MEFFPSAPPKFSGRRQPRLRDVRHCHFEQLEPRQLLAADLVAAAADVSFGHTGGPTGSITGSVFSTQIAICGNHPSAAALGDVRIQLLDETGAVLEESLTDEQGAYRFADLIPGQYAVRQIGGQGLLGGASVVGTGGGIPFGANQVGEIVVQAGRALEGYNFCNSVGSIDPSGPTDRPIVPHDGVGVSAPILALSLQSARVEKQREVTEPTNGETTNVSFVATSPLILSRPAAIFGGSSRTQPEAEEIKTGDEDSLDEFFSTANILDLASTDQTSLDSLAQIPGESLLGESEERSDTPFADGYTVNSMEWWVDDGRIDLDLLIDAEVIHVEAEQAEATQVEAPQLEPTKFATRAGDSAQQ